MSKALFDPLDDDMANREVPKQFDVDSDWDPGILPIMRHHRFPEKSIIGQVWDVSLSVPRRTKANVMLSLIEEVGELSTELAVDAGYSSKKEGEDGIIGEAIDVIICALDMIWVSSPNTTEAELEEYVTQKIKEKIAKWKSKQHLRPSL
jgi:hypothetical protein